MANCEVPLWLRSALRRMAGFWYNSRMKLLLSTLTACFALALLAERQPIERYQPIIDRCMFGKPPPGFDPTKPASEAPRSSGPASEAELQAQAKIKTAIRFSAINVTPEGATAVGFTDSSDAKNPVHYYLKVGESRNGWLVKDADPAKATMTIVKDDVEVTLSIGGNSAGGNPQQSAAAGKDAAVGRGIFGRRPGAGGGFGRSGSDQPGSLRGRRLLREQQRQADEAEAAAKREAEAAQREEDRRRNEEEKAQREAEREEQRAQLMQIQEELRKAREARAAREAEAASTSDAEVE